jgi:hypothetical protein
VADDDKVAVAVAVHVRRAKTAAARGRHHLQCGRGLPDKHRRSRRAGIASEVDARFAVIAREKVEISIAVEARA